MVLGVVLNLQLVPEAVLERLEPMHGVVRKLSNQST